jgi:hypothetical protein
VTRYHVICGYPATPAAGAMQPYDPRATGHQARGFRIVEPRVRAPGRRHVAGAVPVRRRLGPQRLAAGVLPGHFVLPRQDAPSKVYLGSCLRLPPQGQRQGASLGQGPESTPDERQYRDRDMRLPAKPCESGLTAESRPTSDPGEGQQRKPGQYGHGLGPGDVACARRPHRRRVSPRQASENISPCRDRCQRARLDHVVNHFRRKRSGNARAPHWSNVISA